MDKVISITRPAFLKDMKRETNWVYDGMDMRKVPTSALQTLREATQSLKGPTMVGNWIKAIHLVMNGSLLMVDERVSRDLEMSSVIGDLSLLAVPNNYMEMRFADPDIPALLIARIVKDDLNFAESGFVFSADIKKKDGTLVLSIPDSLWGEYVAGQWNENMSAFVPYDLEMDREEGESMRYLVMLAIKVLAYASVPQLGPKLLTTREEQKAAGIHPKHIGKNQKTFSIRYLPHLYREKDESLRATAQQGTHRFLGRRGHVRYYRDERFVNVKGTWQFIPPIEPPAGVQIIYKVRRPSL